MRLDTPRRARPCGNVARFGPRRRLAQQAASARRSQRGRRLRGRVPASSPPRRCRIAGAAVVVDNKPGANGIIGMQEVQRSQPDGYTFMFAHVGAISIGSSIYPNMPLDPVDDLSSFRWLSLRRWSGCSTRRCRCGRCRSHCPGQAEPGNWRYGLPASGSIPHLVVEDTKIRHKLDLPAVPYRSTPQSPHGSDQRRSAGHVGQPRREFRAHRGRRCARWPSPPRAFGAPA